MAQSLDLISQPKFDLEKPSDAVSEKVSALVQKEPDLDLLPWQSDEGAYQ